MSGRVGSRHIFSWAKLAGNSRAANFVTGVQIDSIGFNNLNVGLVR